MADERWRVVSIHTNGYRHVLPIECPTREKAEEIARTTRNDWLNLFRVVVERVEPDGR